MTAQRLEELLSDLWQVVFSLFDKEPEFTGEDAGMLATVAEEAARRSLLTLTIGLGSCTPETAGRH